MILGLEAGTSLEDACQGVRGFVETREANVSSETFIEIPADMPDVPTTPSDYVVLNDTPDYLVFAIVMEGRTVHRMAFGRVCMPTVRIPDDQQPDPAF